MPMPSSPSRAQKNLYYSTNCTLIVGDHRGSINEYLGGGPGKPSDQTLYTKPSDSLQSWSLVDNELRQTEVLIQVRLFYVGAAFLDDWAEMGFCSIAKP